MFTLQFIRCWASVSRHICAGISRSVQRQEVESCMKHKIPRPIDQSCSCVMPLAKVQVDLLLYMKAMCVQSILLELQLHVDLLSYMESPFILTCYNRCWTFKCSCRWICCPIWSPRSSKPATIVAGLSSAGECTGVHGDAVHRHKCCQPAGQLVAGHSLCPHAAHLPGPSPPCAAGLCPWTAGAACNCHRRCSGPVRSALSTSASCRMSLLLM